MKKTKLHFIFTLILISFSTKIISQIDYKIIFYACNENDIGKINNGIDSPVMSIHDIESKSKIEYKKGKFPWEYIFSTNKKNIRIEIQNIYNQKIDTILNLNKKETEFKICEDKFKNYNIKTTISKSFETQKKWVLHYSSSGCFHWDNESIIIYYRKRGTYAVHKKNNKKKLKIKLSKANKEQLVLFEKKIRLMNKPNAGCTTTDTYTVIFNEEEYTIKDSSCLWNGFNYLKEELGFK